MSEVARRKTETQTQPGAQPIPAAWPTARPRPEAWQDLTETQITARVLHGHGFNVLPMLHGAYAELLGETGKPAYAVTPFFTGRLHLCDERCETHLCALPGEARFDDLFTGSNIGVMTGRYSGNLAVFDCDGVNVFLCCQDELRARGIPHWSYTTHSGGHCWVRVREGAVANVAKGKLPIASLKDVELFGNGQIVTAPPSTHRKRADENNPNSEHTIYQWRLPVDLETVWRSDGLAAVSIAQLDWLGLTLITPNTEGDLYGLPDAAAVLKPATRRLIARAREIPEGRRNQTLAKQIIYPMGKAVDRAQLTYADFETLALKAGRDCGLADDETREIMRHAAKPRKGSQARKPAIWQRAEAALLAVDWLRYGRYAQTCRAVAMACVVRARAEGYGFRASVRELAELAGVSRHAVISKALRLLTTETQDRPAILIKDGIDPTSKANRYAFTEAVLSVSDVPHYLPPQSSGVHVRHPKTALTDELADVFSRLGKVALRVWQHLLDHSEPSIIAIARATKQHRGSVARSVKRLMAEGIGLVVYSQAEHQYIGVAQSTKDLGILAYQLGTGGRAAARRNTSIREREKLRNRETLTGKKVWLAKISRTLTAQEQGGANG